MRFARGVTRVTEENGKCGPSPYAKSGSVKFQVTGEEFPNLMVCVCRKRTKHSAGIIVGCVFRERPPLFVPGSWHSKNYERNECITRQWICLFLL
jgi:hypothetical protein